MGLISHFLFGALCGAAIGGLAVALRRRLAVLLPPFIILCGLWGEMPYLLGNPSTTDPRANVFFGYVWLHPWLRGSDSVAFFGVAVALSLCLGGYVAFLTLVYGAMDSVRWEREGPPKRRSSRRHRSRRHRPSRRSSRRHRSEE